MPALAAASGRRFSSVAVEPDDAGMRQLADWVESGQLLPHVSHELPLSGGPRAHALMETGKTLGKIVLRDYLMTTALTPPWLDLFAPDATLTAR